MHDVGDAELCDQRLGRAVRLQLGDELQLEIALHAQACHCVQQMAHALERNVGACDCDDSVAHALFGGLEQRGVDAERNDMQLIG